MKKSLCALGLAIFLSAPGLSVLGISSAARPPQDPAEEVVNNPKAPKDPSMRLVFQEELTIGVKEGDENDMFGQRVYFNTDGEGNFFVTDWDRKRIQKFDPQGKYVLTIGRSGQGPGEFQNVWRPEFDAEGRLYVLDIAAQRMSFFDRVSGHFLREIKLPAEIHPLLVNGRGHFVGERGIVEDGPGGRTYTTIYGLFDSQPQLIKEFLRTVWRPQMSSGGGEAALVSSLASNLSDQAFKAFPIYLLAPNDDIWVGYPMTYEIRVYGPNGEPKRTIRRDHDPRPVTAKDKERFLEEQEAEYFRFLPGPAQGLKSKIMDAVRFPENKPAYASFALMENGWLAVIVDSPRRNVALLDLFDEKGRYFAQFEAAIPTEGLFFKNGKAYAVETTEDGYKFVKRYRFLATPKKGS